MKNPTPNQNMAPSLDALDAIARSELAALPAELARRVGAVVIRVEDFPGSDIMQELELETPFDLLGLYSGVAHPQKSVLDVAHDVDMIFLYRRAILDYWCESGEDLGHLVRHVLIHEIGHHFGFSDEDMARIEGAH